MHLLRRTYRDLCQIPSRRDLSLVLYCFLVFVAISLISAQILGFPKFQVAPLGSFDLWLWIAFLFVSPSITEEVLFRSWILRFREELPRNSFYLRWIISQLAFIAWHPLLGLLNHSRIHVFGNSTFLFLAALLGIESSFLYLHTRSLWPSIIFHWAVVVTWYLVGWGFLLLHP